MALTDRGGVARSISMRTPLATLCVLALAGALPSTLLAGGQYQVTGVVKEVSPTKIVVLKGTENFEMAVSPEMKIPAELKVGAKATIYYTITATKAEVK